MSRTAALTLLDDLAADEVTGFTFADAIERSGRSPTAASNILKRMLSNGLIDRVSRGRYVVRPLGMLGTSALAEDIALAVGAAFSGQPHRIAYRSALDEHDLITHPSRTVYVALTRRTRIPSISNHRLRAVIESPEMVVVGSLQRGESWVSDLERALLDAAARGDLVGGATTLAEAVVAAGNHVDPARLSDYAKKLSWYTAVRRIGSVADALEVRGLANQLTPLTPLTGDIDLEPGARESTSWRDSRWRVRWAQTRDELARVTLR